MPYTLGQAAKESGRSKATIHRAVKAGRPSAARTETGGWLIDPAELHRVYPPSVSRDGAGDGVRDETQPQANRSDPAETALLRERIAEQSETIRRLWERIEADAEERRRLLALLPGPRAPWWRRWFR